MIPCSSNIRKIILANKVLNTWGIESFHKTSDVKGIGYLKRPKVSPKGC